MGQLIINRKFIIRGVQDCGKGTQAKMLAQDFDLMHISAGDVFRWQIQSRTKLAARIIDSQQQTIGRLHAAGRRLSERLASYEPEAARETATPAAATDPPAGNSRDGIRSRFNLAKPSWGND